MITAVALMMVSVMYTGSEPRKTVNSLTNPHSPGRPSEAKKASPNSPAYSGTCCASPPNPSMLRWCARS